MVTEQQFEQLRGRPVRAGDDAEIGTVAEAFLDEDSGRPMLVAVQMAGRKVVEDASWGVESLVLPFDAGIIRTAPELDEEESVSPELVEEISLHFAR